eukprot:1143389-Pelagomonas_calceolata.AAC.2
MRVGWKRTFRAYAVLKGLGQILEEEGTAASAAPGHEGNATGLKRYQPENKSKHAAHGGGAVQGRGGGGRDSLGSIGRTGAAAQGEV